MAFTIILTVLLKNGLHQKQECFKLRDDKKYEVYQNLIPTYVKIYCIFIYDNGFINRKHCTKNEVFR